MAANFFLFFYFVTTFNPLSWKLRQRQLLHIKYFYTYITAVQLYVFVQLLSIAAKNIFTYIYI